MLIDVSTGEVIDKITILEIKSVKIKDAVKLRNIHTELVNLSSKVKSILPTINELKNQLTQINSVLWDTEDKIRIHEKNKEFNNVFIELARNVYYMNDKRAQIKHDINILTSSFLVEEKEYINYD